MTGKSQRTQCPNSYPRTHAVALAIPVVVVLANALAWWPGRRAARLHPAEILRAE